MLDGVENLREFLFKIKYGDVEALNELYDKFKIEIKVTYNRRIRKKYKGSYYEDYIGEVNMRVFKAARKFKGCNIKAFNVYIRTTIDHSAMSILEKLCVYQYDFQSIETLCEARSSKLLQNHVLNVEEYVIDKICFGETEGYLRKILNKEEMELLISVFVYGENLREFADRKHYKYGTVRSCKSRLMKKLRQSEISEFFHKGVVM